VEEPSSPSDGSDNEIESDEGSDRLATSSVADYVCVNCKSTSKHALCSDYIVNRKKRTKMFLSYLPQNLADSDRLWYILS